MRQIRSSSSRFHPKNLIVRIHLTEDFQLCRNGIERGQNCLNVTLKLVFAFRVKWGIQDLNEDENENKW